MYVDILEDTESQSGMRERGKLCAELSRHGICIRRGCISWHGWVNAI